MAAKPTKTRHARWEQAYNRYIELNLRLQATENFDEVEALGRALAKQADELMELRSPHLTGILQKLYIMWGETELHSLDRDSEEKRLLLEDLEALIDKTAELIVMHPDQQPVRTLGLWPSVPPKQNGQQA
jgi:hypothetical protein